jgi:hypothetical protein
VQPGSCDGLPSGAKATPEPSLGVSARRSVPLAGSNSSTASSPATASTLPFGE